MVHSSCEDEGGQSGSGGIRCTQQLRFPCSFERLSVVICVEVCWRVGVCVCLRRAALASPRTPVEVEEGGLREQGIVRVIFVVILHMCTKHTHTHTPLTHTHTKKKA
jgi:hypothetical protein